jgi:hypothetical protein
MRLLSRGREIHTTDTGSANRHALRNGGESVTRLTGSNGVGPVAQFREGVIPRTVSRYCGSGNSAERHGRAAPARYWSNGSGNAVRLRSWRGW